MLYKHTLKDIFLPLFTALQPLPRLSLHDILSILTAEAFIHTCCNLTSGTCSLLPQWKTAQPPVCLLQMYTASIYMQYAYNDDATHIPTLIIWSWEVHTSVHINREVNLLILSLFLTCSTLRSSRSSAVHLLSMS